MPNTNRDKRERVRQALADPAMQHLSSRALARQCGVSPDMVSRMRRELSSDDSNTTRQCHTEAQDVNPLLTGEALLSAGVPPVLARRMLARLAALPASERRRAQQLLIDLLL